MLKRVPKILKNKYILTLVTFLVWMAFFDQYHLFRQLDFSTEVNALEADKAYYQQQIDDTKAELNGLLDDPEVLERFARERYLMKRDNEDIFVIADR